MKRAWLALLFVAACGKSETPSGGGGPPAKPASALPDGAVAEANAAIPAELKGKLEFVAGGFSERDTKLLVPLPAKWEQSSVIPGSYRAPSELGFRTTFKVGASCDGACEAKDWAVAADNELFKQFSGDQFKIEADAKADGSRVLLANDGQGARIIAVAKWKPGAKRYYSCYALLDREAAPASAAFEKACRALTPEW